MRTQEYSVAAATNRTPAESGLCESLLFFAFPAFMLACAFQAKAEPFALKTYGGEVRVAQRFFAESPAISLQNNRMQFMEAVTQGTLESTDGGKIEWDLQAGTDGTPYFDVETAKWSGKWGALRVRAGADKLFWARTEVAKLSNIINPPDMRRGPDTEDVQGRPVVSASYGGTAGNVEAMYFPWCPPQAFADEDARLRTLVPFTAKPVYESGAGAWEPSFALRWSHHMGGFDMAAYYYHGTANEPGAAIRIPGIAPFVLTPGANGVTQAQELGRPFLERLDPFIPGIAQADPAELQRTLERYYAGAGAPLGYDDDAARAGLARMISVLAPYYPQFQRAGSLPAALLPAEWRQLVPEIAPFYAVADVAGADMQYTSGALALKAETRESLDVPDLYFRRRNAFAFSVGGEYSFYEPGGAPGDLTFVLEYVNDSRGRASLSPLQNELTAAMRWTKNTEEAAQTELAYLRDLDFQTDALQLKWSINIKDRIKLSAQYQRFLHVDSEDLLMLGFRNDDNLRLTLSYRF